MWLRISSDLKVAVGSIFFIKEIHADEGTYHLRFCYRRDAKQKISFLYVDAKIDTFIRPVLRNRRIEFKDFTGVKTKGTVAVKGNFKIKKKFTLTKPDVAACKFCKQSMPLSQIKTHRRTCAYESADCTKCGKKMYRHNISFHMTSQCPQRK